MEPESLNQQNEKDPKQTMGDIAESEIPEKKKKWIFWFKKNANSKKALPYLNALTFAESSFFPIPPDPFMAVMVLARTKEWKKIALHTTIFSVLGGVFGYIIGYFLFDLVGQPIINFFHLQEETKYLSDLFTQNTFLAIFVAAFTPIPYKVFTILGGLFRINIWLFILASIIGRGLRFFVVALIMRFLGERYGNKIIANLDKFLILLVIIVIIYFIFF